MDKERCSLEIKNFFYTHYRPAFNTLMVLALIGVLASCANKTSSVTQAGTEASTTEREQFTAYWYLDSANRYTYDSTLIQIAGGAATLIGSDQVDDDNTSTGWSGGTHTGTSYTAANAGIALDSTATLINQSYLDSTWTPSYSSIVGYWKMDETSWSADTIDEVADSSGNANHGTPRGNATTSSSSKMGGYTGTYDGTGDYVDLNDSTILDGATSLTISAWVYIDTHQSQAIVNKWDTSHESFSLAMYDGNTDEVEFNVNGANGNDIAIYTSSSALPIATWLHIVAVWSGTTNAAIYVNGRAQATAGTTNSVDSVDNSAEELAFGARQNTDAGTPTDYFDGFIDEVAIWKNAALSAADVLHIYRRQRAKYTGIFASRIMDGITTGQTWTGLSWLTPMPFYKEFPDEDSNSNSLADNEVASDYGNMVGSSGSNETEDVMDGILGLFHFNESSWAGAANEVIDDSYRANHADREGDATTTSTGVFHNSAIFDGDTDAVNISDIEDDLGTPSTGSISAWVYRTFADTVANDKYVISLYEDANNNIALLYSATTDVWRAKYEAGGTDKTVDVAVGNVPWGKWTHLAMSWSTTDDALKFFINGVQVGSTQTGLGTWATAAWGHTKIGGTTTAAESWQGELDEVGIWADPVHDNEALQYFRRGGNRVKYQVRSCDDSACDTETWFGPDGTDDTYFSELYSNNNIDSDNSGGNEPDGTIKATAPSLTFSDFTVSGGGSQLSPTTNRYFQYRLIFETDDEGSSCSSATCSPVVTKVTIAPTHYDTSNPSITSTSSTSFLTLTKFGLTSTEICDGTIKYQFSKDGSSFVYWNGANWSSATGYAQSNTLDEADPYMQNFARDMNRGNFYYRAYLHSDGTQFCQLAEFSVVGKR